MIEHTGVAGKYPLGPLPLFQCTDNSLVRLAVDICGEGGRGFVEFHEAAIPDTVQTVQEGRVK